MENPTWQEIYKWKSKYIKAQEKICAMEIEIETLKKECAMIDVYRNMIREFLENKPE